MHYLDIIILIVIIASVVEGIVHGFVYEVCSLFGLIAGFFIAMKFFAVVAGHLGFIPFPLWILKVIAFLIILIGINIIFRIVGKSLRAILRKVFMGWLDRIAGGVFGLLRGVFVVLLITMIMLLTPLSSILREQAREAALLKPSIEMVRPFMNTLLDKKSALPDSI